MDALFLAWSVLFLVTFTPLLSGGMVKVKDVRLVNGPSRYEGTVEYTTDNNTWQTTCGVYFGFHDARLVCEHIGAYGTNQAITNSTFGSDLGPPSTFLQCDEEHTTISQCPLSSCSSSTIGAAICYDDDSYLGCFVNDKNNRVLPGDQLIENSTMTINKCITHCRESTTAAYIHVYAGVEYGEECYCGVAGTNYSRLGAAVNGDGHCQTQCTGDPYSSCGGLGHIAIFRIPEALTTINGDVETRQGSSSQQPTTTHVTSGQNDDTTKASNLTPIKPGAESSSTDDMFLPSNTPAVTMQVGYASNLGVTAGAGGGAVALVIILVVIIIVVLYKRRHGRAARKGPLPEQPPDKFDANNYDEILMDSTLGKEEPSPLHRYEDSIRCGMVSKEPQVNMGFAKDEEDLSALYALSTTHRPEAEGAELGDLYAMPDKRKKSHVMRNGASKAMEPSTRVTDALYAMPDKRKKANDEDEEDGTEMVENPIYM